MHSIWTLPAPHLLVEAGFVILLETDGAAARGRDSSAAQLRSMKALCRTIGLLMLIAALTHVQRTMRISPAVAIALMHYTPHRLTLLT